MNREYALAIAAVVVAVAALTTLLLAGAVADPDDPRRVRQWNHTRPSRR